jgi:hypothetical protein
MKNLRLLRNSLKSSLAAARSALLPAFAFVLILGCQASGPSDDSRSQQIRDFDRLEAAYAPLKGVYEGKMSFPGTSLAPQPGQLVMYISYSQDGVNPDGTPKLRPSIRARFQLKQVVTETDLLAMVGDFNRLNGRLVMTSAGTTADASGSSSGSVFINAEGKWESDSVSIDLSRRNGLWGHFEAKLTSREVVSIEQTRDFGKLEASYLPLKGIYEGKMVFPGTSLAAQPGQLVMYISYSQDGVNPDGTPRLRPSIRARFQMNEVITETDLLTMVGDFNLLDGRLVLTSLGTTAETGGTSGSASIFITGAGSWKSESVSLDLSRRNGLWGRFEAKLTSREVLSSEATYITRERARRTRILQKLAGKYVGIVTPPAGSSGDSFCVDLSLSLSEVITSQGSFPSLIAQYARTRLAASRIGQRSLNVEFDAQSGEVSMRDSGVSVGSIPGSQIISFYGSASGSGQRSQLRGTLSNNFGPLGSYQAQVGVEPDQCTEERKYEL